MYSVDEIIEQIDQDSEIEDNLEENNENNEETENTDSVKKVQPKTKRKLGARPKLNAERLKGPRGLICLEKMFSDMKFKGRGYEKQDLNQVMNQLQYWCHRLFPKFTFDDCLKQLENLGTKKPVMTLRKKILYNMMEDEQIPQNENISDEEISESQQDVVNEFDLLLNQQIPTSLPSTQPAVTAEVVELTDEQKEIIEKNRQLAAERRRAKLEIIKQKENEIQISQESEISDEQRLIIEQNRLLAVEKRKHLQNKTGNLSQNIMDTEELTNDNQTVEIHTETNENQDLIITNEEKGNEIIDEERENENLSQNIMDTEDLTNDNQTVEIHTETNEKQDLIITNEEKGNEIMDEERKNENCQMEID